MRSSDGLGDIRAAVAAAERQFQVIDGGKGGGNEPPEATKEKKPCPVVTIGHLNGAFYFLDRVGQLRGFMPPLIALERSCPPIFPSIATCRPDWRANWVTADAKGWEGMENSASCVGAANATAPLQMLKALAHNNNEKNPVWRTIGIS